MKKFNIIFLMSLLIASMDHAFASNEALQQEQVVQFQADASNEEFPQLSTEQYLYAISAVETPVEPGVMIAPEIVSDKTVGNYFNNGKTRTLITQETKDSKVIITTETWKTANPSYMTWRNGALAVGAVAVTAFTYMALSAYKKNITLDLEKYLKKEGDLIVQGSVFSYLKSDEQRVAYLKDVLKDSKISDDFNFSLLAHYMQGFSNDNYVKFFEKIDELAQKDKSNVISMDYVDQACAYVMMRTTSRSMEESLFPTYNEDDLDRLEFVVEKITGISIWLDPKQKKNYAYHEAAHALMTVLENKNIVLSQFSLKPQGLLGGVIILQPQSKDVNVNSVQFISQDLDQKNSSVKNDIKMYLAGGIGHELLDGEKLNYKDFLVKYGSEIGDPHLVGSDINKAVQRALEYSEFKNFTFVSKWQEDLEPYAIPSPVELQNSADALLEECYEDAYKILSDNKDMLDTIVEGTLREGVSSGDKIYNLVGVLRPKYNFELTSTEKVMNSFIEWLSWTSKKMAFYDRNTMQV